MLTKPISVGMFVLELLINVVRFPVTVCTFNIVESKNVEPNIIITRNKYFDLNIDRRFHFRPGFAMSPFSSVGEPLPLPKHFKQNGTKLLHLQKSSFRIVLSNQNSCDILTEAVDRYNNIINDYITEEHYHSPFNFNKKIFKDRQNFINQKYKSVSKMPDLEIAVMKDECGYPHLRMNESYSLDLRPDTAKLTAEEVWGALRGLETFSQLLFRKQNIDDVYAKVTEITDSPRFPHRGILLDTARHFIYKNTIKDLLDGMAFNKLNVLHWHIVDDSSFPYKSEVFPKLSEKAAFHPTLVYTLSDVREIVEYARYRGIRVIPEFDTPAHTFSWFGYPDIISNCYVGRDNLGPLGPINPAKNETYDFMAKLFSEIFEVFPETFVHLGGDEVVSSCWTSNPEIKSYLEKYAGIPITEASYYHSYISKTMGYYFKRLIPILKSKAREKKREKEFMMWEDTVSGDNKVPNNSVIQIWKGNSYKKIKSLHSLGYRTVSSTCWYLDKMKENNWFDLYNCDPSPYNDEEEERGKVLGGEVCLWAEFVSTDSLMTTMWPRASLIAERLWSPRQTTDIMYAASRVHEQRCRMIYRGLATGQISGPDYCLRNVENSPVGQRSSRSKQEVIFRLKSLDAPVKHSKKIKNGVLDCYYLPAVSLSLIIVGIILLQAVNRKFSFNKRSPLRRFYT